MSEDPHYNCSNAPDKYGGRGVTLWGPVSAKLCHKDTPGQSNSVTWSFTGTQPKCYQSRDNCNFTYTIHTETNKTTGYDVGPIKITLNGQPITGVGDRYHSKLANHDLTETLDIGSQAVLNYNDDDYNTITFINDDPEVDVWINNFQIVRVYGMCGMDKEDCGCCIGYEPSHPLPCPPRQNCNDPGRPHCGAGEAPTANGTIDNTRQDYPCNKYSCGNRLSYSIHPKDRSYKSIPANGTATWTWTNPRQPLGVSNYVGKKHCLFNLNNIQLRTPAYTEEDVHFTLSVNNSSTAHPNAHFYLSRVKAGRSAAVSVDLATTEPFSLAYIDTPEGGNTVVLTNLSSVELLLCDGSDDEPTCDDCFNTCDDEPPRCCDKMGCIDVYRVYETTPNCYAITAYATPMQGSISPSGSVPVPIHTDKTFNIYAYAGYVIDQILVDGSPLPNVYGLSSYEYPFTNVTDNRTISVSFASCGSCQTQCQTTCQISCQPCQTCQPCETCNTCQTGCELACQTGCEVSCQVCYGCLACYACYISCQEACQQSCQNCQTSCELSCQTCYTSCQETCQLSCQTCYSTCQETCQLSCQTGCEVSCEACQELCDAWGCQGGCQGGCQTSCEISCQNCQTGCEVSCQSACQLNCQETCQVSCQEGCYNCYYCASCLYCEVAGYL